MGCAGLVNVWDLHTLSNILCKKPHMKYRDDGSKSESTFARICCCESGESVVGI